MFLPLDIAERHDPIFKSLSQNQKMYVCLVEGCGRKFWGEKQRRLHLVDLHKYPQDFDFNFKRRNKTAKSTDQSEKMKMKEEKGKAEKMEATTDTAVMELIAMDALSIRTPTTDTLSPAVTTTEVKREQKTSP